MNHLHEISLIILLLINVYQSIALRECKRRLNAFSSQLAIFQQSFASQYRRH